MGSIHLILLSSSPINYFLINPRNTPISPNFNSQFLSPSSSKRTNSRRFDFDFGFDFDDDFRKEKRKNWWSDDDSDSDDDEDEDDEFGFFKESNPIDWVFQVLKTFGWMVPALIMSTVLGTGTNFGTNLGTNSLIMAVVLPLSQTALSLAIDKLVASPSSSSKSRRRYKTRPKPKPRPGPRSITRARAQESRSRSSLKRRGGDQSWRMANSSSVKKGGGTRSKFGGWDELDEK